MHAHVYASVHEIMIVVEILTQAQPKTFEFGSALSMSSSKSGQTT